MPIQQILCGGEGVGWECVCVVCVHEVCVAE